MKSFAILVPIAVLAVAAPAAMAETRPFRLSGFNQIDASNHVRVVLRQGPYSVTVEEPDGRFGDLILEVRGDTLVASRRNQDWTWRRNSPQYTITVSAPDIREIEVSNHARLSGTLSTQDLKIRASNHARVSGGFTARTMDVVASNHGSTSGDLRAGSLAIAARNHGDLSLKGSCDNLTATVQNHGELDGVGLDCRVVQVDAGNHGHASVRAGQSFSGQASNHGGISVHGQPAAYQGHASNHGSIRRL